MAFGLRLRGKVVFRADRTAWEPLEPRAMLSVAVAQSLGGRAHTDLATYTRGHAIGGSSTAPRSAKTPAQVRTAYGLNAVTFNGVTGNGAGQTIAIVDAYDYPTALGDLNAFSSAFGLPTFNSGSGSPTFTKVSQTGSTTDLPDVDTDDSPGNTWEVEEALDIEWAHAMAPGANIMLVEADSSFDSDLIEAAVGYARSAPGVSIVSMSFGGDEGRSDASDYNRYFTTPGGHGGVTFLASTGDAGSPGGYPAYSSNVIAVGGTSLYLSGGNYASESGWDGSGGGISDYAAQPDYQKYVVTQSTTKRAIPDVSMLADPSTGVALYDSYDFGVSTPWLAGFEGGTSLATPLWAGVIAVANQGRVANGLTTLDGATQTLPALYALPTSDFHDITSGNNGDFSAGTGYDLVTGRGSPVGNKVVVDLASTDETNGTVTATDGTDANGVSVSWSRAPDADGYTVYRAASTATAYTQGTAVGSVVGNAVLSFEDTTAVSGTVYRYFVVSTRTVNGTTLTRAYSASDAGSRPTGTVTPPTTGSISGTAFNDTNANGVRDGSESLGSGKTVFLDANNNGKLDSGEKSVITGSAGTWTFTGLAAGTYHVRRVFPSGYTYSTTPIDLTLTAGQVVSGLTIGSKTTTAVVTTASLAGYTFDDTNADGILDNTESKSSGKTVFLDTNNNGKLDGGEKSVKTGTGGVFSFTALAAGTYHVRKVFPTGYTYSTTLIDLTLAAGDNKTGLTIGSRTV